MQKIQLGTLEQTILEQRGRLLTAINSLPAEEHNKPNVVGEYSIAQVLIILTEWYDELLQGLRETQRRKKPTQFLRVVEHEMKHRKVWLAENRQPDVPELLEYLEDLTIQIEMQLEQFNHKDLNELKRIRWLGNKQLWPFIARNTYQWEAQFVSVIEAYAKRY